MTPTAAERSVFARDVTTTTNTSARAALVVNSSHRTTRPAGVCRLPYTEWLEQRGTAQGGGDYRQLPVVARATHEATGEFYHESIRTILQLAHCYVHTNDEKRKAVNPRHAQAKGGAAVHYHDASALVVRRCNPAAATTSAAGSGTTAVSARCWTVRDLEQGDTLLFVVRNDEVVADLLEAIDAMEGHLRHLHLARQVCPTRALARRRLLNDLYMHVYPALHWMLQYIRQKLEASRAVVQLLSTFDGGVLHSGNVIDVYEAVARCVGEA